MILNNKKKKEFWENGFITINNIFSESFINKLCDALESSSIINEINNIPKQNGGHSLELTIINPIRPACNPKFSVFSPSVADTF